MLFKLDVSLQWRHMRAGIIRNSAVQKFIRADNSENIKVPYYWPFMRGINR